MEVSVLEGEVELRNSLGPVTLSSGQQGVALPGQRPTRTAVIAALNVIQWCLYYPAVLDVVELALSDAEQSALKESLAAWRSGDLLKALQSYPENRQPVSERERVYRAALLLVVGETAQAESLLPSADTASPFSNALRELIAAVQFQTYNRAAPPVLATEWLAESYYRQSRAGVDKRMLEDALKAAEAAGDVAPNSGLAWERLAELEFSFGRTGKALVALDNAIRLSPRNAQALALKGFLLSAQNKIPQALEYFDQAIAADGALANAWLGRGLCRIRQGNAAAGREDLLVAAALEPQRAVLRSYLGKAFSDAGDRGRNADHRIGLFGNNIYFVPNWCSAFQFKLHGFVAGCPAAGDRRKPFQEWQPARERNVFAKDDELPLVINIAPAAIGSDEKGAVEKVGRGGMKFHVVAVENNGDAVRLRELVDGAVGGVVNVRHGGFRPEEQSGFIRERALRAVEQFVKAF